MSAAPVAARLVDDGEGRLLLGGSRYLLIRPETLAGVQQAMERVAGAAAGECLAEGGRAGGARVAAALTGTVAERVEALAAAGTAIGWGRFTVEELGPERLVLAVANSPFAEAHGPAAGPVCHLLRGVLDAVAASLFSRPVRVRETSCAAAGAAVCRFEARP